MSRDLPIGNGNVFAAFDCNGLLREFHFPHVGEENHAGEPFRLGAWTEGHLSWVDDGEWKIKKDYLDDTLITNIEWLHEGLRLRIISNDLIHFEDNLYLKKVTVENLDSQSREICLFFSQNFQIYGNAIGDTAAYKPEEKALFHYKRERAFLINILANNKIGIDWYATGNLGTWQDAEDGVLSSNPIAQGSVDSVFGVPLTLPSLGKEMFFSWIASGKNWEEVVALHTRVKKKTPEVLLKNTADYWKLWVDKEGLNIALLPKKIARLYKRSLLICRTLMNNCGSIIAAADSDAIFYNRDTYSYLWPRDGALVAYAMDLAGYNSSEFFRFCNRILTKEGYFSHKYSPSGMLGSSWHPWVKNNKPQLPIQEDETGLILWALWKHFERFRDMELIRSLYESLIKRTADFMMNYRDIKTGLPLPSYDLWEERQGILTFTASTVYGGLIAASRFTKIFGETGLSQEYADGAKSLRDAMDRYLYLPQEKRFARMIHFTKDGSLQVDATIDASLYGIFSFGAYSPTDERVKETMRQVFEKLEVAGGICRYEQDAFYRANDQASSNPWFVTTLWKAQYLIASASSREEIDRSLGIMQWVVDKALPSGVLAEQIDAMTLEPASVAPLNWSHGTFIATVHEYIDKFLEIEKCPACGQPKYLKTGQIHSQNS